MTKSSKKWLREHFSDTYVKQAKKEGYRSRAAFKLIELQQRDHLFKPGMKVVDLGAAPGGWAQIIAKNVLPTGQIIAIDLLPMEPIDGVNFFQADFTAEETLALIDQELAGEKLDWVVSDMAPNISGNESVDIPKTINLAELALDFACKYLKPSGGFLIKVFQGSGFDGLLGEIKNNFKKVAIRKPKASRGRSREVYILARELKIA